MERPAVNIRMRGRSVQQCKFRFYDLLKFHLRPRSTDRHSVDKERRCSGKPQTQGFLQIRLDGSLELSAPQARLELVDVELQRLGEFQKSRRPSLVLILKQYIVI